MMYLNSPQALRRPARLVFIVGFVCIFTALFYLPNNWGDHHPTFHYQSSSFNWSAVPQRYPVDRITPLPAVPQSSLAHPRLPRIQHNFVADRRPSAERVRTLTNRRLAVKAVFLKSWTAYKEKAWLHDELAPVSGRSKDTFGGWAATLVDALDTMYLMGLKQDFYQASAAVAELDWSETKETACNFFETTIRHLGGLLSAYDLSQEPVLLKKAVELGEMLFAAFDTPNRMPPFWLDFERAKAGTQQAGTHDASAAAGSASLEFTRLAQLTGDDKYYDAIDRVTRLLERTQKQTYLPGMWPTFFNLQDEDLVTERSFTMSALADSLYEYIPKMTALLGGAEPIYEKMYRNFIPTATKHILFRPMLPEQDDILFSGSANVDDPPDQDPEQTSEPIIRQSGDAQHLSCFVAGMYALGGRLYSRDEDVEIAAKLARGCVWLYNQTTTGIMPEIADMHPCPSLDPCPWDEARYQRDSAITDTTPRGVRNVRDPRYILRPEAIESVFIMYRVTGDVSWQDIGWQMFNAIREATETELAFSAIRSVVVEGGAKFTEKADSMESFWLAETLKYFYLLFSPPDVVTLDEWVLNTEAHPLRRTG